MKTPEAIKLINRLVYFDCVIRYSKNNKAVNLFPENPKTQIHLHPSLIAGSKSKSPFENTWDHVYNCTRLYLSTRVIQEGGQVRQFIISSRVGPLIHHLKTSIDASISLLTPFITRGDNTLVFYDRLQSSHHLINKSRFLHLVPI